MLQTAPSPTTKEPAPDSADVAAAKLTKRISDKYAPVKRYAYEGNLEVARQKGEDPREVIAKGKVKLEIAPGGKFLIRVKREGSEYSIVSDGSKTWVYVPELNQYTEQDSAKGEKSVDSQGRPLSEILEWNGDMTERFARQIIPVVTETVKSAALSFIRGPVLTVIGKKDAHDRQTLLYLSVNPESLVIPRLTWLQSTQIKDTKYMVRSDISFTDLRFDKDVPDADFTFTPPADANRVDALEIPGRSR